MEELIGSLGGSSALSVGLFWYFKKQIITYQKKIYTLEQTVKEAATDNVVQTEQITQLREENKEIRRELRDLRK